MVKSFELRKTLEEDLAIIPLVELKVTKTHYSTAFFRGNVGMLIIGEWFPGQLLDAKERGLFDGGFTWEDWAVTRLPSDLPEYRTFGIPTFNHVHADSDDKAAAFEFIAWMGGADGAVETAKAGMMPARFNDTVKDALRDTIPDAESFAYYTEAPTVMPHFFTKYGSRIEQVISDLMEAYLVEEAIETDEVLGAFERRLTEIIRTTD